VDKTTKWLIAGFVYILGAMGMFFITFFNERGTTFSDAQAAQEALIKGALWPIEVLRLVL